MLLIDLGNTRLKWSLRHGDDIIAHGAISHRDDVVDFSVWDSLPEPEAIWLASVAADALVERIAGECDRRWSLALRRARVDADCCGLRVAYAEPARLGIDRWLAMLAATDFTPDSACCVVDCGSAITIDLVLPNGHHQGGLIMPGIAMMRRTLIADTAAVRLEGHTRGGQSLLADNTRDAVEGGTLYAALASVERIVADLKAETEGDMACFITGGDAARLRPLLAQPTEYEPELVLDGLQRYAEARS